MRSVANVDGYPEISYHWAAQTRKTQRNTEGEGVDDQVYFSVEWRFQLCLPSLFFLRLKDSLASLVTSSLVLKDSCHPAPRQSGSKSLCWVP